MVGVPETAPTPIHIAMGVSPGIAARQRRDATAAHRGGALRGLASPLCNCYIDWTSSQSSNDPALLVPAQHRVELGRWAERPCAADAAVAPAAINTVFFYGLRCLDDWYRVHLLLTPVLFTSLYV